MPAAVEEPLVSSLLLAIVNARGVIDQKRVEALAGDLAQTIGAGATRLLVDLSSSDDVATAGMNTLLAARQWLAGRGGRIAVVLSPAMRRRFEALALDRRFLIADDRLHAARLLGVAEAASPVGAPRPHAHAA